MAIIVSESIDDTQVLNMKKILLERWTKTRGQKHIGPLHISDILHCLRRVAFERLDENPPKTDERGFRSMLVGSCIHREMQENLGEEFECEKEISYTFPNNIQIIGHIDAFHKPTSTVIEFKTSNAVTVKDVEGVYSYHITQLQYYMALSRFSRRKRNSTCNGICGSG